MLNFQNISFENRIIVAINVVYVLAAFLFASFDGYWYWDTFVFWCSIPAINALLYWIIAGYKRKKGTQFSFMLKLIIALWFFILLILNHLF